MARLPELSADQLSPAQKAVHDAIVAGPRGRVEGPLRVWLYSPDLASRAQALGAHCRFGSSLPARLSELAIIVVGAYWRAGFEWHVHAPIAIKEGISPEAAEAIRTGKPPAFERGDEAIVYAFVNELNTRRAVSDTTYRAAVDMLGVQSVVDLVGIAGYYTLISMSIVAFEVGLPGGAADPFADVAAIDAGE